MSRYDMLQAEHKNLCDLRAEASKQKPFNEDAHLLAVKNLDAWIVKNGHEFYSPSEKAA